ncbi:hypothetical protein JXK06_02750 [Patescibacteria group bacterium]|nr:hypothetical protein [Patescibacteria group bacterium]
MKKSLTETLNKLNKEIGLGKILGIKELAKILKEITLRELKPGGPYQELNEKNPSAKLNLAIFEFLKTQGVSLPNLTKFLKENNLIKTEFEELDVNKKFNSKETVAEKEEREEIEKIFKLAKTELLGLDKNLVLELINTLKITAKNNPDKQMLLMPFYFYKSLGLKPNKKRSELITKFGLINAYFWTAFIIYDDFWDEDEKASPGLLPLANLMSRELFNFYFSFFRNYQGYNNYLKNLLNEADSANYFETKNCRFLKPIKNLPLDLEKIKLVDYGDYEIKFFPAATHTLGPLAIMADLGFKIDDREIKSLEKFFCHYLIARQLNDDLHDYKEDLKRGHLSPVVNETLREARVQGLNLINEEDLAKIFWLRTLKTLAMRIIKEVNIAEKELKKIKTIKNPELLLKFCRLSKSSALKALKEREASLAFIKEL